MNHLSKELLASLLREAEKAHAKHEEKEGKKDAEWPSWYANYIVEKLNK
jgi:hypothetical protein